MLHLLIVMITERLKTVLSHFDLTPSAFADAIGVPRSSISHLLSGRNKASLDFVIKLVNRFPEVDLYWLLYGRGQFPSVENPLDRAPSNSKSSPKSIQGVEDPALLHGGEKISKIVFFYEDGSFETYRPKK